MKQVTLATLFVCSITTLYGFHPDGKEVYEQKCFSCHGNAKAMAQSRKQLDWEKLMFSSKKPILELHKDHKDAHQKIATNCQDTKREKLFAYFVSNAQDLGPVPGCK